MFEDSKTELYVCSVTNGGAAIAALPNNSGGFYKCTDHTLEEQALEAGVEYEFIHRNSKGVLNKSPRFTVGDIVGTPVYMATTARTEQVTYFGYNGVSGSLDAANSTYYSLRLVLNHTFGMLNNSPLMLTVPYQSDSSATQSEVAAGLAIEATKVIGRQAHKFAKVERVNSGAQLVALDNLSLQNGSKYFTSADDDTGSILVGSILRVEEPENNGGAVTDPCYVVVAHDGGALAARIYELDQPFQGVTNAEHDQCETVTEGNWGLKFTGISVADAQFDPLTDTPFVVNFDIVPNENFETAVVTESVQPFIGRGTYQLVAAQEVYTQFQNKTREVCRYPQTKYLQSAVAGITYAIFSFVVQNQGYTNVGSGQRPLSVYRINIACETSILAAEAFDTVLSSIDGSTA
jgi:hypothetical protein